tara:strand:- start:1453 stop:2460 length:1008 start_codon:yes stop_codon:yes gene_type:complete
MGKGREIPEKNVKPHHRDKSVRIIVDGSPVHVVELEKSREVRQEPLARLKKRPVGVENVRPDGFSTRHRTDSARIKDGRTLNKGIQLYRHWFQYLKLALELETFGDKVEIVTRNGRYLPTEEPFIRVEGIYEGQPNPNFREGKFFMTRDTVRIRVNRQKYEGWDLDEVLSDTFNKWWKSHSHLFEGHYPTQITSKDEWDDSPEFIYVRIDKSSRTRDVDEFMRTIKRQMSAEGSPRYLIDGNPRPDVLQNRYNALVMGLKGIQPKEICTHKNIYLRATEESESGDGERLSVPLDSKGKPQYPIPVKQQRDGGVHHLLDVMKGSFGSVPQDRGFRG